MRLMAFVLVARTGNLFEEVSGSATNRFGHGRLKVKSQFEPVTNWFGQFEPETAFEKVQVQVRTTSDHIRSHQITSDHITSHHITSHRIASHHITSHHEVQSKEVQRTANRQQRTGSKKKAEVPGRTGGSRFSYEPPKGRASMCLLNVQPEFTTMGSGP